MRKIPIDPKLQLAYRNHKANARGRGIPFKFTRESWLEFWQDSGHLHERGPYKGQYVMARFGDKGAYEIGNVRICTVEENHAEKKVTPEGLARMRAARNDPEKRDAWNEAVRKAIAEPEVRAKKSAAAKRRWEDPAYRAKQVEDAKNRWKDPIYIANVKSALNAPEVKAKASAAKTGNTYWVGRKHKDKTKAKISASKMGNQYWLGRHHTEETCKKISEAKRKRNVIPTEVE